MKKPKDVSSSFCISKCIVLVRKGLAQQGCCLVFFLFMRLYNCSHYASTLLLLFCAGVCLGMQLAVCEFARNVLGWEGE